MSRTSKDIYKLKNGKLIAIDQATKPPKDSTLYSGYNYILQKWFFEGKVDTRTLREITNAGKTINLL